MIVEKGELQLRVPAMTSVIIPLSIMMSICKNRGGGDYGIVQVASY